MPIKPTTSLHPETNPVKRVCVYCASSDKVKPAYFETTAALANHLADAKITVVYGGGAVGLMGQLATTMLERNGRVIGIMPHFMRDVEWAHKGVKEFHFTADMHERKKKFLEETDALIALPGGTGTLEELFEALTLKKLGLYTRPIIIVNMDGFYDPLIHLLDHCVNERFMSEEHKAMWTVVSQAEEVIPAIYNAPRWSEEAIHFATVK